MTTDSFSCTVPARAALAGNPSDGHGGAVVATVVASLAATVTATPDTGFEFAGAPGRFRTIGDVSDSLDRMTVDGDHPLMRAAVAALHRRVDGELRSHRFDVMSTIPRSVGLAGSSAIVVATLRTMIAAHRTDPWARHLVTRPELIASLALEAERDVLGISAGLQDRVVQTLGGTVAMDFASERMRNVRGFDVGSYRSLGRLPDGLFVAYRATASSDSGLVHAAVDPDDPVVHRAMRYAAEAGRAAADAIERSDRGALGAAMDATFDQRAIAYSLDPAHVEMVDAARADGASANYTGSGGSVIVLAPDARALASLSDLGCTIVPL